MRIRIIFGCLLGFVSLSRAQNSDIDLLRKINIERNTDFDGFYKVLTHSMAPISLAAPVTVLAIGFIQGDTLIKRKGVMITGSLLLSTVVMVGMKWGIDRDRPFVTYQEIENLIPAGSPAFPSGHASMAFSTATSISIAYPKWYVIVPSFLWASGVGYSRMHLGVHYPSDVLVGAIIGSGSAFVSNLVTRKFYEKRQIKRSKNVEFL
ncbi:MAG: membrane-associated phospholipid phosphatase [Flavobacteriaceae bacterium]|jgi:membrane-associated phospholipid phosphatase